MLRLESDEERIVGVLHDIVEETEVSLERLKDLGFSDRIVQAIDYLTWMKDKFFSSQVGPPSMEGTR